MYIPLFQVTDLDIKFPFQLIVKVTFLGLSHNTSALAKPWSLNEVLLNDSDFDDEKGNDLQFEEGDPENGTRVTPLLTSQTPSDVPIQIETPPAVLLSGKIKQFSFF